MCSEWVFGAVSLTLLACSSGGSVEGAGETQQALTPSIHAQPGGSAPADKSSATASVTAPPPSGTWTAFPANTITNSSSQVAILLTDGSLLVQSTSDWHVWSKFTPSSSGSYASGTWTAAASTTFGRLYYPYGVLRDGRVFVAGGEYLTGYNQSPPPETDHAALEIYDPLTNTWSRQADSPLGDIGDVPYQVLADGRVFMGYRFGQQTEIFDPTNGTWSASAPKGGTTSGTEETWSLLPSGAVLNWVAPQPQIYLPSSNQWVNAAIPPVTMQNTADAETGPAVFLPTGKLVAFSAFGNLVLYTPGATPSSPGSWTLGPSAPPPSQPNDNPNHSQYTEDVPACIEPNGKVLFVSSDTIYGTGKFNEYDPATNTVTAIAGPPVGSPTSYTMNFVALPTGQILLTGAGADYLYTPTGVPSDSWAPSIQSITANADGSYTLSGTQLNGLSQGASYGDEGNAQTNFPLVRLTQGSTVRYARTYAFSTMGFATGSTVVQTHFKLPAGIPNGTYQLSVVTNGIASPAVAFTVGQSNQPPTAAITAPANNATFTAPAQITINASASDMDGTISKVEFYGGTTLLGTDTTAPYSFVWSSVPVGSYSLTVKAYDNANAVTTSAAVNVVVSTGSNQPPTASITSPANNATFTAPAQITINANAADSDGTISKVEFYRGTTLLGTDTTAPYSFVWSNVAAGSYALTVKAYDNLNAVTTSSAVNVVVNSAGTTPCSAWCTSPLVFSGPNYQSGNLGTGAVCRETTAVLHGGNCSNISGRTLTVNGVAMNCGGWTLPAPVNGGYCVQVTAGTPDYTSFATW